MEKVTDTTSSWKSEHVTATEVRFLMTKDSGKKFLTDGADSLLTWKPELKHLRGLSDPWPDSLTAQEIKEAHETTLSLLGVHKNRKNAIADPSRAISIGLLHLLFIYSPLLPPPRLILSITHPFFPYRHQSLSVLPV